MKSLVILVVATLLSGCATTDPTYTQRANETLKHPPRAETESPEQKAVRESHEKAFGRKIEALSQEDQVEPAAVLKTVAPEYPFLARSAGKTGVVHVAVIIGVDGVVTEAKVVSSTDPIFDAAALDAVRQWRYKPAKKGGKPIAMAVTIPVVFQL